MKALEELRAGIPEYAKDLKLNLQSVLTQSSLDETQRWGVAVATAIATRNAKLREATLADAANHVSPEVIDDARAVASMMGMNNVYYRFTHLVHNEVYRTTPAKLRMQVIGAPGVEKPDFELWCMAVSAVNGCGMCMDAHEAELRKAGFTTEQIQASVRIGAVVNAVSRTLAAEAAFN